MFPVRLRYLRLFAGLGVLLATSCLPLRPVDARDGRSRTPLVAIEDLPDPSSHARISVIVDIAPLRRLDRRGSTTVAASPPGIDLHADFAKIPGSSGLSTRLFEAEGGERESIEKSFAVPGPVIAPHSLPREGQGVNTAVSDVNPSGEPSEEAQSPALTGNGSMALVPTASRGRLDPIAIHSASVGRLNLDLDVKPTFTFVEAWGSRRDGTARWTGSRFTRLPAPKPPAAEAQTPGQLTPGKSSTGDGAGSDGVIASSLIPIGRRGEVRGAKRAPALSAIATDVQRVWYVIPPMQLPKPADRPEKSAVLGGQQPWDSDGPNFRLPSAWLSQPSALPTLAQAEIAAAESETKANDPSANGDDKLARKAEQQRKPGLWQRIAKAQAASASKAAEEQELKSSSQFNVLRLIKQLMRDETEIPEVRAYASLLEQGVRGPAKIRVADRATLWLPFGYVFLEAEKVRDLLDGEESVLDDTNFGVILPTKRTPTWMAYVDVIDQGHIKDDDANALEPTALLAGLTKASGAQNVERGRNGLAPLSVSEWIAAPKYVPSKHIMNSCVSAAEGVGFDPLARLVNCASLALGRRGAIKVLVTGALSNLVSFQSEAANLAAKIAYNSAARYEGYVPEEDESAGYGLVGLAGTIVGLKDIAAPVAAAGAGKSQAPFLYAFLAYWEAILAALIATGLGAYWFLRNQAEGEEESGASRHAARMPLWKAASWAARSCLRSLFERKAAPTRVVDAHANANGIQPNPSQLPARSKVGFAGWQEKLASVLRLIRSRGKSPCELEAESEHTLEPRSQGDKLGRGDGKQDSTDPGQMTASMSVLRRLQREQVAATSHAQENSFGAKPETPAKSAENLNRLASLMREKTEESMPSADATGLPRSQNVPALSFAGTNASAKEDKSAEATSPGLDLFDLVEPGDADAVSMAVFAREAVQKAHG